MEIRTSTRNSVGLVEIRRNIIQLDGNSNPLELQKCQPEGMSRFILGMENNAILSNYKSIFISQRTTCAQAIILLGQICFRRLNEEITEELYLFIKDNKNEENNKLIPMDNLLANIYLNLLPGQILQIRRVEKENNNNVTKF
uniref:Uncharacterized protein n=1 Tax=Meloidogyne enterolobii TaxID=390850 RepID=A0A6V7VA48_MELEN|nr:unnamed protein product [Meloidogyne enterolobii]